MRNSNNSVVASGGPYTNNASGEQFTESFCLAQGCYDFTINDSEGDGMYGSQFQSCTVDGSYSISDGNSTLIQTVAQNADYGLSETQNFCIGGGTTPVVTCEELVEYDGEGFFVNPNDLPNFDIQAIDNDQEPVSFHEVLAGFFYLASKTIVSFYTMYVDCLGSLTDLAM